MSEHKTSVTPLASVSKRWRTVHAGAYTFQKNYSRTYSQRWSELEKRIVLHVTGDLPYPFKPYTPCLSSSSDNKQASIIASGGLDIFWIFFN